MDLGRGSLRRGFALTAAPAFITNRGLIPDFEESRCSRVLAGAEADRANIDAGAAKRRSVPNVSSDSTTVPFRNKLFNRFVNRRNNTGLAG
jgi:hypothetical protein